MRTSYKRDDVEILLKDITGLVQPQSASEREKLIQSGRHYCEMLPIEYVPSAKYMEVYQEALKKYAVSVADAVGRLADRIMQAKGEQVVLISLARAGIPIGILLKRYLAWKYKIEVGHYAISIIRDRGIDRNAMAYLLQRYEASHLQFVDGWIGKGAILKELKKELEQFPGVSTELAVVADPAKVTSLYGTQEDILIPSSCLNSTISGLISRTFLREDIIGKDDFHGAIYYEELAEQDLSYAFIHAIEEKFSEESFSRANISDTKITEEILASSSAVPKSGGNSVSDRGQGIDEVRQIAAKYGIENINLIKPGIGETTRVLLRRVPWKILIDSRYRDSQELAHILRLAEEKQVLVEDYPLKNYRACGIIKKIADE